MCREAFITASSRNERQFIQRRGRILRTAEGKTEAIIHNSGFIFLILLVIMVTFRDITKYGGQFLEAIKNIF